MTVWVTDQVRQDDDVGCTTDLHLLRRTGVGKDASRLDIDLPLLRRSRRHKDAGACGLAHGSPQHAGLWWLDHLKHMPGRVGDCEGTTLPEGPCRKKDHLGGPQVGPGLPQSLESLGQIRCRDGDMTM